MLVEMTRWSTGVLVHRRNNNVLKLPDAAFTYNSFNLCSSLEDIGLPTIFMIPSDYLSSYPKMSPSRKASGKRQDLKVHFKNEEDKGNEWANEEWKPLSSWL